MPVRAKNLNRNSRVNLTLSLILAGLLGCGSIPPKTALPIKSIPLFNGLGTHHFPITTSIPDAQRYFDQGLILAFGFNHLEAARSFQEAYRLDPNCALCYWGEALALGPNINAPMDAAVMPQAFNLVGQALSLSKKATHKEQALISALAKRYSEAVSTDRIKLDEAYAAEMRKVAQRFPDDALIGSLFAESLMDLHPWNFWTKQGKAQPWTSEIVSTLEHALKIDANNPLANHLYIHAMEASTTAEKALPSARRLPSLVPNSGHLVHMPAHIYIRIGHYRDAILANQQAVKIDQAYLGHEHPESIYTIAYVPHNHHFLWAAAIKTGQKQLALKSANDTADNVKPELMRDPALSGTLQHFYTIPLVTKALFGEWDMLLKEPPPAVDLLYIRGVWHYVRGLAFLRKSQSADASHELEMLKQIIKNPELSKLNVFSLNPVTQILQIAEAVLEGEIAAHNKNFNEATASLQRAVEIEDGLNYTEPKDWYLPPRQILGAVLLEAGETKEAEHVYRKDLVYHPQNGWSLFGLMLSLQRQGKYQEAKTIKEQFENVWRDADVKLTGSRF
jgi:tetratricopeptide (TPR) repeat protein